MPMKYSCLPWIAFSNCEIFTVVFSSAMLPACCLQTDTLG